MRQRGRVGDSPYGRGCLDRTCPLSATFRETRLSPPVLKFLLRRLVNSLLLVAIATSAAYLLAAASLNPRANFAGRNPPPPVHVVDARLTQLNLNDKTPILKRYVRWVKDIAHGNFGQTWDGQSVKEIEGPMPSSRRSRWTPTTCAGRMSRIATSPSLGNRCQSRHVAYAFAVLTLTDGST